MGFPDFPIPEQDKSYLTQAEILHFLDGYAEKFNLKKYIKFNTMVMDVRPNENNNNNQQWQVTCVDKPVGQSFTNVYDSVLICNGHYNDPIKPNIAGQDLFGGVIEHSHNYRNPERFRGQKVLVIGAGPSGLDLTLHISSVAQHVVLSHRVCEPIKTQYPNNVEIMSEVKRILDFDKVEFVDGSCRCFDAILFCTGYSYSFPFLHESCGITVDDNHIQPLYKHMIHIERPSMCFIGIPFNVCTFQMFDLQVSLS